MNFTADLLISDKAVNVVDFRFLRSSITTVISPHKNKELILTISMTQTNPFPIGDYILKYIIHMQYLEAALAL